MSLVLVVLAFFELVIKKRGGRFFFFFIAGIILNLKNGAIHEYAYWDLILLILIFAFVLSRLKINHKGI